MRILGIDPGYAIVGFGVAQARGVILLSARQNGIKTYEYTPLQVKNSIVGYGRAEKKQVQEMTRSMLKLKDIPKPDDAADALALAITHGHNSFSYAFSAYNGRLK